MPSANIVKEFAQDQVYHVYNRGVEKRDIFLDDQDYSVFIGLLKKYLTGKTTNNNNRHAFSSLKGRIDLLSFCLMPNHFHLLFYQKDEKALTQLMRRVNTGYVMYFNNRYGRVGSLFQGIYKASLVEKDDYLHRVSRYIHANPDDLENWPYSSFQYYKGNREADWLKTDTILELFDNNKGEYIEFVREYSESKNEATDIRWQLADLGESHL